MSGERHPCDYCGTMLDDDDCVESDIPAINGPTLHSVTQCREYVAAALRGYMRDAARFRQALADAAEGLVEAREALDKCVAIARKAVIR